MGPYESIALTHEDGVTELRFHTDGGELRWNGTAHREAGQAFAEVGSDRDTKVVIVTGTGDAFCSSIDHAGLRNTYKHAWEPTWWHGKRLLRSLLDIDVPVIGAVNGPAFIHAEIPLLADVVIASDTARFADKTHFVIGDKTHLSTGFVPGDGVHLIWPWLIGHRRAKYFLMTGQEIDATESLRLGFVNEVVPLAQLRQRAWQLAREWAAHPLPFLRYTREALNTFERQYLLSGLAGGLALEGIGLMDSPPQPSSPA